MEPTYDGRPAGAATRRLLIATLSLAALAGTAFSPAAAPPTEVFLVKPYLQLGYSSSREHLTLMWHTRDEEAAFGLETKITGEGVGLGTKPFRLEPSPSYTRVAVRSIEPHRVWSATIYGLRAGDSLEYRVLLDGKRVFTARARAPRGQSQPYRFAVFGDTGQDSPAQKTIAYELGKAKPDFVFVTGDIVYNRGRISEYRPKYFPIFNADRAGLEVGAPLLRSVPFVAAPGNHDIANTDLGTNPDGLAYFYYWRQPLNGPMAFATAPLEGPEADQRAFRAAAGGAYPRMANFSFDYGNSHWTVLDSNSYVDWRDPALRRWVADDLAAAKRARWRFVGFHHPGFHSSRAHFKDQQMRVLADLFEAGGVDLVFAGHVHNYQRTFPMRYQALDDSWTLDSAFDGVKATQPKGVIYIVTGAGGASLYDPDQQDAPDTWQSFTTRFISKTHSVSVVDIDGGRLTLRQVGVDGEEVDRFVIVKP